LVSSRSRPTALTAWYLPKRLQQFDEGRAFTYSCRADNCPKRRYLHQRCCEETQKKARGCTYGDSDETVPRLPAHDRSNSYRAKPWPVTNASIISSAAASPTRQCDMTFFAQRWLTPPLRLTDAAASPRHESGTDVGHCDGARRDGGGGRGSAGGPERSHARRNGMRVPQWPPAIRRIKYREWLQRQGAHRYSPRPYRPRSARREGGLQAPRTARRAT